MKQISVWEHDEALRRLKAESQREADEDKLIAMVLQQRRLVEESRSKTARRRGDNLPMTGAIWRLMPGGFALPERRYRLTK